MTNNGHIEAAECIIAFVDKWTSRKCRIESAKLLSSNCETDTAKENPYHILPSIVLPPPPLF
jgi:hypothetical protein